MKDSTYERFLRHSTTLVPIGLAGLGLVATTIYRLVTPVSDDLKKNLTYAEVALSLVTSSMVLLYMGGLFMTIVMQVFRGLAFNGMTLSILAYSLLGLLINPFALTLMRLAVQDKINDTVVSSSVIASTGLILFFTWAIFVGTRGR
jgi:hypothetical protein